MTSDIGVAAFCATIFDESADPVSYPFGAAFGAGCHPNRVVAMARALTEAAQSRLTVIAGARDDVGRQRYAHSQSASALLESRRLTALGNGPRQFGAAPHRDGGTLAESIDHIAAQLAAVGLRQVLSVDLGDPSLPVSVVRVIVPGLEGPSESPRYVAGARVRAQFAAAAT